MRVSMTYVKAAIMLGVTRVSQKHDGQHRGHASRHQNRVQNRSVWGILRSHFGIFEPFSGQNLPNYECRGSFCPEKRLLLLDSYCNKSIITGINFSPSPGEPKLMLSEILVPGIHRQIQIFLTARGNLWQQKLLRSDRKPKKVLFAGSDCSIRR